MDSATANRIAGIFDRAKAEALALLNDAVPIKEVDVGLLNARDVAAMLHTNTQAVYRLAREGKIPPVQLGARTLRWTEEAVSEFISQGGAVEQDQSTGAKSLRLMRAKG